MIDAEGDYEGKYAAADRYVRALRARIGATFPVALAGFPYVDYHPSFPYSVFFGPGRRHLQPAADVLEDDRHLGPHRLRAHLPLQPHLRPPDLPDRPDLRSAPAAPRSGSSAASPPATAGWRRAGGPGRRRTARSGGRSAPTAPCGRSPATGSEVVHPLLKRKASGDMVVWAQEHLIAAGADLPVTGIFGRQTARAVRLFKEAHGLPANGDRRHRNLERPARLHALPAALDRAPARAPARSRPRASRRPARSRRACPRRPTRSRPARSCVVPCRTYRTKEPRTGSGADPGRQPAEGRRARSTISSPSASQTRGLRPMPTPSGVPVETMSPGSSVISCESWDDQLRDAEDQVVGGAALHLLAVEGEADLDRVVRPRLVGRHQVGTAGRRAVEDLARHPLRRRPLQVAGREVVEQRVAGDVVERLGLVDVLGPPADDEGDLGLVVGLRRSAPAPSPRPPPARCGTWRRSSASPAGSTSTPTSAACLR